MHPDRVLTVLAGLTGQEADADPGRMPAMRAISAIPVANCSQYPDLFSSRKSLIAFIPLPRAFSVL